jgi:ribosome biogenesis ATPase
VLVFERTAPNSGSSCKQMNRNKSFYLVDRRLVPRIKQYFEQHPDKEFTDTTINDVIEYLKKNYREYQRKSEHAMRLSVEKVRRILSSKRTAKSHSEETEIVFKRKKRTNRLQPNDYDEEMRSDELESGNSSEAGNKDSDSLEVDSSVQLIEVHDTNYLNNKLLNTYKQHTQQTSSPPSYIVPLQPSPQANGKMDSSPIQQQQNTNSHIIQSSNNLANDMKQLPSSIIPPATPSQKSVDFKTLPNTFSRFPHQSSNLKSTKKHEHSFNKTMSTSASELSTARKTTEILSKKRKLPDPDNIESVVRDTITEKINKKPRPTARYSDLGGIDNVLKDIRELIHWPLSHPEIYAWLGVEPAHGILLHGPPGCGKTHLATAIAGELDVPFYQIAAPEIVSGMSGESEQKIRNLFSEAVAAAPSIIFIDEIDAITPKRETASREMERRIVAQILACMDDITLEKTGGKPVIVIGATNRPDALDPALRRAGRFDREIALGVPDENARANILKVISSKLRLEGNFDFRKLAKLTPGFVGADLAALAKEAAAICINRIFNQIDTTPSLDNKRTLENTTPSNIKTPDEKENTMAVFSVKEPLKEKISPLSSSQIAELAITMSDFEQAIKKVQPSSKREGFATIPDVTWADIGALENIRKDLEMAILEPIRSREKFEAVGLVQPCGVLLYGPPGCGKTLLAKAVANECQANFISIKGPELLNKYVGESERAVRQVFQRAQASKPCIIFFDELDALCPRRGLSENQVTERVVNQLLIELDGLNQRSEIFVVAATNRPDMIDPAMLRPGRLDKLLYVPLPSPEERVKILKTCARKTPLAPDVNLEKIALSERCNGFSGADLASLVREAATEALRQNLEQKDERIPVVNASHFEIALRKVLPSVSKQDEQRYDMMQKQLHRSRIRNISHEDQKD